MVRDPSYYLDTQMWEHLKLKYNHMQNEGSQSLMVYQGITAAQSETMSIENLSLIQKSQFWKNENNLWFTCGRNLHK